MGFLDHLRKQAASQLIEIIEWLDDSGDSLVHRFAVYNQKIKMGAKPIVRENQQALVVNEGKATDLFAPGLHTLSKGSSFRRLSGRELSADGTLAAKDLRVVVPFERRCR